MDLKEYYRDLHVTEANLQRQFPDGIVYVTSVYHRERNSRPGQTLSAGWNNAARVLTDGTHRIAKKKEIAAFLERQEQNRANAMRSEQIKKQQYIVVVDPNNPSQALPQATFTSRHEPAAAAAALVEDDDDETNDKEDDADDE